jgi:hypothetical protein
MASPFEWRVKFKQGSTWYQLPDLNGVSMFRGRRQQIDDYSIDTMTLTSLFPSSWTTTPKLGDEVRAYIYKPGEVIGMDAFDAFWGRIRNVKIDYGMVPNEDRVTIECEGLQADWGRAQLNSFAIAQDRTDEQVLDVATEVGLTVAQTGGRSIASGQTYTGNAFAVINDITRTEEARIYAYSATHLGAAVLAWYGRNVTDITTYVFNDGTGTAAPLQLKYDGVQFRSTADNYYNEVTITPAAVAQQTASLGTTPVYGWQKDTLDATTGQAADHAQYLLNNFQNTGQQVQEITLTDVQQVPRYDTGQFNIDMVQVITSSITRRARIHFRGGTYRCVIEGVSVTAVPGVTRVTLYVSAEDTNAYLILDDAVYGRLDFNKLGY